MNKTFIVDRDNPRWDSVVLNLADFVRHESAARPLRIAVGEPKRPLILNDKMWAVLTDIAEQVPWPVDGKMQLLAAKDWKEILSAGLRREQRVAQGIDGGFVLLGTRTSEMTKAEISELIEFVAAFGADKDVVWTEPQEKVPQKAGV